MFKKLPAFAGRNAGDNSRAVINGELRVTRAKTSGDALDEDFGLWCNENGHKLKFEISFCFVGL